MTRDSARTSAICAGFSTVTLRCVSSTPRDPPRRAARCRPATAAPASTRPRLARARNAAARPGPGIPRRTGRAGRPPAGSSREGLQFVFVMRMSQSHSCHPERSEGLRIEVLAALGMTARLPAMSAPCPSSTISGAATTPTSASSNRGSSARARRLHPSRLRARRRGAAAICSAIATAPGISIPRSTRPDKRTAAMRTFLLELARARPLQGPVARGGLSRHLAVHATAAPDEMERAAVPWFGVRAFGPHMTGYVRRKDGLHIWVPRRSYEQADLPRPARQHRGRRPARRHRPAREPDQGMRRGSLDPARTRRARPRPWASSPTGTSRAAQLKPDIMTCFDLELPEDFTPRANDGEVHSFELWPVSRVFETVRDTTEFKYNCNLVLIDFFVRHGLLVGRRSGLRRHRRRPEGRRASSHEMRYIRGRPTTKSGVDYRRQNEMR